MLVEIPDVVYVVVRITLPGRVFHHVDTVKITSLKDYLRAMILHEGSVYENKETALLEAKRRNSK